MLRNRCQLTRSPLCRLALDQFSVRSLLVFSVFFKTIKFRRMACEAAKMFVGGIARETTEDELQNYFSKYGNLVECNLKKDPFTGFSRGFAFITFDDPAAVDLVIAESSHTLGGKTIDPKKMRPKGAVQDCTKIFVGGVDPNLSEAEIRDYFQQFGQIESINLPFDKERNMRKGFCFINFESSESVDSICTTPKHPLGGREVDVRRATPQEPRNGASRGGFRPRGGSGGWMGGMRNQQPVHMGIPYNNFASYYGQEVPYGGYSSYPDNGMSDSQGGQRQQMNMNGRSNRGGMNDRYQPY